jgi:hypothetical protein
MKTQLHRSRVAVMVMAAILLFCSSVFGQDENAKKFKGYRLKEKSEPMHVFGDFNGKPNFCDRFALHDNVFVVFRPSTKLAIKSQGTDTLASTTIVSVPNKEISTKTEKVVKEKLEYWVSFLVPGTPPGDQDNNVNQVENAQNDLKSISDSDNPCKGNSPIGNLYEKQIGPQEYGRIFWIKVKDNDTDLTTLLANFDVEYRYSRFSIGVLAVPFKYRFSWKGKGSQITGEGTLGTSLTYDFYHNRSYDERFSFVFGAGITVINPNGYWLEADEKEPNIPGASLYGGIVGKIKQTQLGLLYGYDFASEDWAFSRKPWLSFSVGVNLINPTSKDDKNSD